MSFSQFLFIVCAVIMLSIGQILFKNTAVDFSQGHLIPFKLILAVTVYFFATVMWFFVLKVTPLKVAYPFVGLAFILVPFFSYIFLGEDIHRNNILGALVICLGVCISVLDS